MEQEEIKEQENKEMASEQPETEQEGVNGSEAVDDNAENQTENHTEDSDAEKASEGEDHSRRSRKRRNERHLEELNSKVEEMGKKLVEMNDKYLRTYSEYENYRKRTSAEKSELILNGGKDVIKLMLPIIDDMERALANMSEEDVAREGLELILKNMLNALRQKGLKPMEAKGAKFDESFHEAIARIPAPTPEAKDTVIDVVKKGYFLNEEVLRYAQVVVAV